VSFKAKSLAHAARLIDGLNEEMTGKSREEVDADQVLVNLLRGVPFSGNHMNDRTLGSVIVFFSLLGIGIYFWLLFMSPWVLMAIQVSAFLAVTAVLFVMTWIGYTLATTPPLMVERDVEFEPEEN